MTATNMCSNFVGFRSSPSMSEKNIDVETWGDPDKETVQAI